MSCIIKLDRIAENYRIFRSFLGKDVECSAVLKADAYGLGVEKVSNVLYKNGCKIFFVASLGEAIEFKSYLANDGYKLVVLNGFMSKSELDLFRQYSLVPVINSMEQIEIYMEYCISLGAKIPCFMHFDTGLSRLGLDKHDFEKIRNIGLDNFDVLCVMSHLAPENSESSDFDYSMMQLERFWYYTKFFPSSMKSFANSSGIFLGKEFHFDMVRPGFGIFGGLCNESVEIKQVVELRAKILQRRIVYSDSYVGYGMRYLAKAGSKLFTIGIGYRDGYRIALYENANVYTSGYFLPIAGEISMDLTVVDASLLPEDVFYGTESVEVLGDNMTLPKLVQLSGRTAYEVLPTLAGYRYKKDYVGVI